MEFKSVRLVDCCKIKPPKAEAKKILSDEDLVSFVPMSNLGINTKGLILNGDKKLSEVSGSYTYFAENDVLLAKITPCFENGKLGIATGLTNGVGFGSSEYVVFRSKGDVVPDYLYYYLLQPSFRETGQSVMTGAVGHKRVPKGFIENTEIPLPPIPEQKRIVAILDQAFADIDLARANAEQNLKNARELFESYLQQVFSQRGEGWVTNKLKDIATVEYGFTDKSTTEGDFRYIRITDIDKNGELIKNAKKYINFSIEAEKFFLSNNDLLMARTGATFAKVLLYKDVEKSVFASYLIRIAFTEKIENELYWYFTKTQNYWEQANKLSSGAAQPHFNGAALKQVIFSYPKSTEEQLLIIEKFKSIFNETQQLETIYYKKLIVLEELKKSILQKAFTGELTQDSKGVAA